MSAVNSQQASSDPKRPVHTPTMVLVRRLLRDYMKPYWRRLAGAMLLMAVAAAMTGALAKLIEPVFDQVFAAQDSAMLYVVAGGVLAAFVLRGIATYFHSVMMNRVGQRIVADVQSQLFGHLMRADLSFFQGRPAGELIARMVSDCTVMRQAVAESMTSMVRSSLTLFFLVIVMFHQDWKLATAAFVVFPLSAWFVARLSKRLRRVNRSTQAEIGDLSGVLNQVFQGIRQVKAYGMEAYEQDRANRSFERLYGFAHKTYRISALTTPMGDALSGIAIVAVILYGGQRVIGGDIALGALLSFITAFLMAYEPMKRLAKFNGVLQKGLAASERIFDLLDRTPGIVDSPSARDLTTVHPSIRFEGVAFTYPDGTSALSNLSLEIEAGRTVALVGPSGAGKSTILNLIPRFYDVTGGAVQIDGHDVRDVTLASLRENIALVSQEVAIFDDSVRNNIAYGRWDATDAEIENAARSAAAHGFILDLDDGYATRLGENGVKLSGGQRQRIAIARAILRNAPILLLDEATSSLDADSERLVQDALARLREGRTTLVIAHRLSTVRDADLIYVLEDGRVVEQGRHHDLLARRGVYSRLYAEQIVLEDETRAVAE